MFWAAAGPACSKHTCLQFANALFGSNPLGQGSSNVIGLRGLRSRLPLLLLQGGIFSLKLQFSERYPEKPPRVRFTCDMFHPNVRQHFS